MHENIIRSCFFFFPFSPHDWTFHVRISLLRINPVFFPFPSPQKSIPLIIPSDSIHLSLFPNWFDNQVIFPPNSYYYLTQWKSAKNSSLLFDSVQYVDSLLLIICFDRNNFIFYFFTRVILKMLRRSHHTYPCLFFALLPLFWIISFRSYIHIYFFLYIPLTICPVIGDCLFYPSSNNHCIQLKLLTRILKMSSMTEKPILAITILLHTQTCNFPFFLFSSRIRLKSFRIFFNYIVLII